MLYRHEKMLVIYKQSSEILFFLCNSEWCKMFKNSVLLIIALIALSNWVYSAEINDKFHEEEIFPDILDDVTVDLRELNISYLSSGVNVSLGNELRPSQVTIQPDIQWEANETTYYTLLMTGTFI